MISSAKVRSSCSTRTGHPATCRMMRATCSRSPLASFLFEERAHRALVGRWFERVNEIAKPFGENFRPKFPVMSHARREDVMSKESVPTFPEIPVHHSVNMMKMDSSQTLSRIGKQHGKIAPALRLRVRQYLRSRRARFVPARRFPSTAWSRRAEPLPRRLAWRALPHACSDALARPDITLTKRQLASRPIARWR